MVKNIYGSVSNAKFEHCQIYVYGMVNSSQFDHCQLINFNKSVKQSDKVEQLEKQVRQLKNQLKKVTKEKQEIEKNAIIDAQSHFQDYLDDIKELKDKIQILSEVNHAQARRITELEHSHDNNFDKNWEYYPSKKVIKELSEILTIWLDCEDS